MRPPLFTEEETMEGTRTLLKQVWAGKAESLPAIEWAPWWDETVKRWEAEGLPKGLSDQQIGGQYGLDAHYQIWVDHRTDECPKPAGEGAGILKTAEEYHALRDRMYSRRKIDGLMPRLREIKKCQEADECFAWVTLDGFFWHPRTLFGIEEHLYAFYDSGELMHEINSDYAQFCAYAIEKICDVLTPDFVTFAEDLSYNLGPMLSKEHFEEFLLPYYQKIVPMLHGYGIPVFVDTDGDVAPVVPWLLDAGVDGILPLERQSMVDVCALREQYPDLLMMGGFDKRTMHRGEEAMRAEFERILPAIRAGKYLPSADHQTPPDVSMENYRIYVSLLKEYCNR